jgi:biotin carboxyl carrier protein
MQYEIIISGKTSKVSLSRSAPLAGEPPSPLTESYGVQVDGGSHTVSILKREPDQIVLSFDQNVVSVRQFKRTSTSVSFLIGNELVLAETKGSKTSFDHMSTTGGIASLSENVTANFPAKVVKVEVKKGDHLKENDTLVVLEAMKMEALIKTPRACTVSDVFAKEGTMVEAGKLLVKLKFD